MPEALYVPKNKRETLAAPNTFVPQDDPCRRRCHFATHSVSAVSMIAQWIGTPVTIKVGTSFNRHLTTIALFHVCFTFYPRENIAPSPPSLLSFAALSSYPSRLHPREEVIVCRAELLRALLHRGFGGCCAVDATPLAGLDVGVAGCAADAGAGVVPPLLLAPPAAPDAPPDLPSPFSCSCNCFARSKSSLSRFCLRPPGHD